MKDFNKDIVNVKPQELFYENEYFSSDYDAHFVLLHCVVKAVI